MQTADFSNSYVRFVQIENPKGSGSVWAVQNDRPTTTDAVFSYFDRVVISKANYTLDQLDDLWRAAKVQGESEEIIKAIRTATFDDSLASFELVNFITSKEKVWCYCFPIALEGMDRAAFRRIAIRKSAITAKNFTKEQLRDFHVKAICQNKSEDLIQHIEKTLIEFDEVTA